MCGTKYLNKFWHFEKYLAKSILMQNKSKSFSSVSKYVFVCDNYNFIIVTPG